MWGETVGVPSGEGIGLTSFPTAEPATTTASTDDSHSILKS
jgi:hypothetical protein